MTATDPHFPNSRRPIHADESGQAPQIEDISQDPAENAWKAETRIILADTNGMPPGGHKDAPGYTQQEIEAAWRRYFLQHPAPATLFNFDQGRDVAEDLEEALQKQASHPANLYPNGSREGRHALPHMMPPATPPHAEEPAQQAYRGTRGSANREAFYPLPSANIGQPVRASFDSRRPNIDALLSQPDDPGPPPADREDGNPFICGASFAACHKRDSHHFWRGWLVGVGMGIAACAFISMISHLWVRT